MNALIPCCRMGVLLIGLSGVVGTVAASEIVYAPINPSFGGSPLNGAWLMNSAQAQNDLKDPTSPAPKSALERFNEKIQQAIENKLVRSITGTLGTGDDLEPGTVDAGSFTVTIENWGDDQLKITTTDKATGASTVFIVDKTS